ncbi:hypothetical protein COOONC_09066, partial [Cooperia oncophora]
MYQGIDAVGVDIQPIENYNEWRMIYFISFLLLVGFFVLNMFVGVVVENFHKCKEALEKEMREKAREKRLQRKLKRQKYEESVAGRKKKGVLHCSDLLNDFISKIFNKGQLSWMGINEFPL